MAFKGKWCDIIVVILIQIFLPGILHSLIISIVPHKAAFIVSQIVSLLLSCVLGIGLTKFFLDILKGKPANLGSIFFAFN